MSWLDKLHEQHVVIENTPKSQKKSHENISKKSKTPQKSKKETKKNNDLPEEIDAQLEILAKEQEQMNRKTRRLRHIREIDLGYNNVAEGKYTGPYEDSEDSEETKEKRKLDPNEIVIKCDKIIVIYDYPLKGDFEFEHFSKNPNGFTRKEIAKQIMKRYKKIYKEEKETSTIKEGPAAPGSFNRNTTSGKYGIWGHGIGDLILHSMIELEDGSYMLGLDS